MRVLLAPLVQGDRVRIKHGGYRGLTGLVITAAGEESPLYTVQVEGWAVRYFSREALERLS